MAEKIISNNYLYNLIEPQLSENDNKAQYDEIPPYISEIDIHKKWFLHKCIILIRCPDLDGLSNEKREVLKSMSLLTAQSIITYAYAGVFPEPSKDSTDELIRWGELSYIFKYIIKDEELYKYSMNHFHLSLGNIDDETFISLPSKLFFVELEDVRNLFRVIHNNNRISMTKELKAKLTLSLLKGGWSELFIRSINEFSDVINKFIDTKIDFESKYKEDIKRFYREKPASDVTLLFANNMKCHVNYIILRNRCPFLYDRLEEYGEIELDLSNEFSFSAYDLLLEYYYTNETSLNIQQHHEEILELYIYFYEYRKVGEENIKRLEKIKVIEDKVNSLLNNKDNIPDPIVVKIMNNLTENLIITLDVTKIQYELLIKFISIIDERNIMNKNDLNEKLSNNSKFIMNVFVGQKEEIIKDEAPQINKQPENSPNEEKPVEPPQPEIVQEEFVVISQQPEEQKQPVEPAKA